MEDEYEYLPDDCWLEIMKHMDTATMFTMTKVNKRLRALANYTITPQRRFRYNLQKTVPEYGLDKVTATKSKKMYMLTDNDLRSLSATICRNPYYRSASPMRLYEHAILLQTCMKKYVTWEYYMQCKAARDKRSQIQISAIQRNRNQRRETLTKALSEHGLELRDDSYICQAYITNGYGINGESLDMVVEIMREMDFLVRYTDYADMVRHPNRYDIAWYQDVHERAKQTAIEQWRRRHPTVDMDTLPVLVKTRLKLQ